MVDQLGRSTEEVVILGATSELGEAPVAEDDGYRDEFEGEASSGPGHFMPHFAARALSTSIVPVWYLDGGEE